MKLDITITFDEKIVISDVSKYVIKNIDKTGEDGFFDDIAKIAMESLMKTLKLKIGNKIIGE